MHLHLTIALWMFAAVAVVGEQHPVTTVILVRHAEKAAPAGDPPLTEAGTARAQELARMLEGANVQAIYVTQYIRTQRTAEPLAKVLGIEPVRIETGQGYARAVTEDILKKHAGQTVLVIGHNNTTADVLRQLGIADAKTLPDKEFDDLFVCTIRDGSAKLLPLRYGVVAR